MSNVFYDLLPELQFFLLHLSLQLNPDLLTFVTISTGCLVNLGYHLPELLATDQVDSKS